MKITANELVFQLKEGKQCHASSFITLSGDRVFCAFFYGSEEGRDDVRICGAMRGSDGSWSDLVYLSEDDSVPHWNPVLMRRRDGAVVLFYKVGKPISDWYTKCRISYDECKTWSDTFELVEGDRSGGRGPVKNKAIYLKNGTLIAPASTEKGEWKCFFDISVDDGKSWTRSGDLSISADLREPPFEKRGIIQPSLWESRDGVHALLRSSEGRIYRTDSKNGIEWSQPYATNMPNNNSGIDVCSDDDQRVFLVCNPVFENWGARSPISLYESRDNGKSFSLVTHLETGEGEFSYPAIRYESGRVHITYTWKRRSIRYICIENL